MKALSIRQPFAWLISHGFKDVENRSVNTKLRGAFLVHASKTKYPLAEMDRIRQDILRHFHITLPLDFDRGGIVGSAEIHGVTRNADSAWFSGPVGYQLRHARPLKFFPCNGRLGFFDVDYPFESTLG